jgi:uncharacterized protein (DUF736 family)
MSELGRLQPSSTDDLSYLSGHIQTLEGRLAIALEGDESLCDQQRPSHRVITRARDGSMHEIGAAWLKTARHGQQKGKRFFSIQIDHPERPAPLNVAAFFDDRTGEWVIVWRRRGVQSPGATAA